CGCRSHRLETTAPQSRRAANRVLATVRADPALPPRQGGVRASDPVGGRPLRVIEQVEAASNRNDRSAAARTPGRTGLWRSPASWAGEEPIELAQHPQRKKAGTQPN